MPCSAQDLLTDYNGSEFAGKTEQEKQVLMLCLLCKMVENQSACCESMVEQLNQANVLLQEIANNTAP